MHFIRPVDEEKYPGIHGSHEVAPDEEVALPAEHSPHEDLACSPWKRPGAQTVQGPAWPVRPTYLPASHEVQLAESAALANVPRAHGIHKDELPGSVAVPGWQGCEAEAAGARKEVDTTK